jgi:nitroreductase
MDTYEALESICIARHSTREFLDTPVPDDLLKQILSLARTSPYVSGSKSWDILVIQDKQVIAAAADIVKSGVDRMNVSVRPQFQQGFIEYARSFSAFETAGALLVPVFRVIPSLSLMMDEPTEAILQMESENFAKSISCVTMLVLLAAQSLGLGSCYMTGPLIVEEELRRLFNTHPGRRIGSLIPIGYAANSRKQ